MTGACILDAFSYFEPVKRADRIGVLVGSRNFNNSTCERVMNLLEPVYLRLSEIVEKIELQ